MTLGLAMLARNNEQDIPRIIDYFRGQSSDFSRVSIVLGGQSSDNTEKVARQYADFVAEYTGPLDENGGLLDFAHARQQSFDLLDTDYALVIDTDDEWSGVENLGEVIRDAEQGGFVGVMVTQDRGVKRSVQTRIFKRESGRWESPVHEWFRFHQDTVKVLTVNALGFRQTKDRGSQLDATRRNIRIAEKYIEGKLNIRMLHNLASEYLAIGEHEKSINTIGVIFENLSQAETDDITPPKMFELYWNKAMALYALHQLPEAMTAIIIGLRWANFGDGWALLSEISYQLGNYDLTIFAADKALALGNPIDTIPTSTPNISYVPYLLKARALCATNRKYEALAAVNLGIKLGGGGEFHNLKYQLCQELGVIP